jgi:hypothetical protein
MGELDARTHPHQAGIDRGVGSCHVHAQRRRRTLQQGWITNRFGGSGQYEELGVRGKQLEAPGIGFLDPAGDRKAIGQPEPAGELGDTPRTRELKQRQRVAVTLGDDALAHCRIQRASDAHQQQGECITVAQSFDGEFGEPRKDLVADPLSSCADEQDTFSQKAASDKGKNLSGRLVEPLRVVDDADQWLRFGDFRKERERGEPHEESVWPRALVQAEHGCESAALGAREPIEAIEHRCTQLMKPAVRELHLGLDAGSLHEARPRAFGALGQVVEQCALADTGLATKNKDLAPAGTRVGQEAVKQFTLGPTPEEAHGPRPP